MRHLVIGVPARNEASTIVALAAALEEGAALLGEATTVELVLAYQDSTDDTLDRFLSRPATIPQRVLRCPPGTTGKGRNVKLLLDHAVVSEADLLLVDGDMRDYAPAALASFVAAGIDHRWEMALPLWCRSWGHANVTNYLAVPVIRAVFGARIRQPLAGQRWLSRQWLGELATDDLPDDYGIDVALTMAVLVGGGCVGQVVQPGVHHDGRQLNSGAIMVEVGCALLARIAERARPDRSDVVVAHGYAERLSWPEDDVPGPNGADGSPDGKESDGQESDGGERWLDALTGAVQAAVAGAEVQRLVDGLVAPFLDHADRRRSRPRPSLPAAEDYVWALSDELATRLS